MRDYLMSDPFKEFQQQNPQINFEIFKKTGHPYISGVYINGFTKEIGLKNESVEDIAQHVFFVRSSHGRPAQKHSGTGVHNLKWSVQGGWKPNTFANYPKHRLEVRTYTKPMDFEIKHYKMPIGQYYANKIKVDKVRTLEDKVLAGSMDFEIKQSLDNRIDTKLYKAEELKRSRHTEINDRPKPWIYDRTPEPAK